MSLKTRTRAWPGASSIVAGGRGWAVAPTASSPSIGTANAQAKASRLLTVLGRRVLSIHARGAGWWTTVVPPLFELLHGSNQRRPAQPPAALPFARQGDFLAKTPNWSALALVTSSQSMACFSGLLGLPFLMTSSA